MITSFQEWRDWASEARYPFMDPWAPVSADGRELPDSNFIDAAFTPIDLKGPLRLSLLGPLRAEVSDDSGVVGVCSDMSGGRLEFFDRWLRPVGMLVKGAKWAPVAEDMLFVAPAGEFCLSCVEPQNHSGVRGLLVGGSLLTGEVLWRGEGGMRCDTRQAGGIGVVRLSAWPDPARKPCSPLPAPITCVKARKTAASPLTAVSARGVVSLGCVVELADSCQSGPSKAARGVARGYSCDPAPPPDTPDILPASSSGCEPGDAPEDGLHLVTPGGYLHMATERDGDALRVTISARSEL
jgi:hypothetical protein